MDNRPVALITGCSHPSSLGAALSRQLVKRGWKVFASALVLESMQALADDGCMTLVFDVTKEKDIQAAKSTIGSRLDLLINNAAVEGLGPLLDTDHRKMEEMFRINVFAPLAIIQAFSDTIIASRGCIVNIGSVGVYGLPFHGIYASSKAALQVMSDVLRREMAPFKVTVITVELGKFTDHSRWALLTVAMVMTAMLKAEDPFDLNLQSTQRSTAFEKWYTEIQPKYRQDLEKRSKDAMSASVAAETIIKRVTQRREGKIWVGTMAWIFRWVWPFLSTRQQDKINCDLLSVHLLGT